MKSLAVILVLLSFEILFAQGEYIDRGQNAYGIGLSAGLHPKIIAMGGSAAISNSGTFDFGISYTYLFSQEQNLTDKSTSTAVTPFAGVHILKQSGTNPISVSAMLQYQVHRLTSIDGNNQASLGSWAIGASVFRRFEISQKFHFQPLAAISFIRPEKYPGEPVPNMVPAFQVSAAFISMMAETSKIILKPSASFSSEETFYSLSFEFVDLL